MSSYSVVQSIQQGEEPVITSIVETYDNLYAAFVKLHEIKAYLWNTSDIYHATVKVLDEKLVEYKEPEEITHPEPEPEPEPEEA